MPPNKYGGTQGLYSAAVAMRGVSVPVGQCVEGTGMRVTVYDVGVMATKWLCCNVPLYCLCLDTFQDDAAPSRWASK